MTYNSVELELFAKISYIIDKIVVQSMRGVLMKTNTRISYVILKYDDQTDRVFTKTQNNGTQVYEAPGFDFVQKSDSTFADIKEYVLNKMIDFDTKINENHVFIPLVNVTIENGMTFYNYTAIIFESNQTTFSSMNFESWHRVKYNRARQTWNLTWGSGLTDPVDYIFKNVAINDYAPDPKDSDEVLFSNVMHFIAEQTKEFPILGLMSGEKFTMKQVLHYQDLLGIEALKAGNNATFENQYSDSIQPINDNRITTSYKIKPDYLKNNL